MDTKWTPGHWHVLDPDSNGDDIPFLPIWTGESGGNRAICDVQPMLNADDEFVLTDEEHANARLIAAAPALYEALAECRTDLMIAAGNADHAARTDPRWEGVGEKLRERVRQADAALSAAHGKEG